MNAFEKLSISEIAQRIVDLQETNKENSKAQTEPIKNHLLERHNNYNVLRKDVEEVVESITALVDQYNSEQKGEREKVIKKIVFQKIELVIESILHQETRMGNGLIKNKREYIEVSKKCVEEIIELSGKVLAIAITSHIFYPFVLKLVKLLRLISLAMDCFIPIAYYPLYMMSQMAKIASSPVPLQAVSDNMIKVTEKYVNSKIYSEYIMINSLDIISHLLVQHSRSMAFPEYSAYIIAELKRIRNAPNKSSSWINSKTEAIFKGAREHTEKIERIREGISALNVETVRRLEERIPEFKLNIE
ncbi:hypothetical protein NEMIN01_1157 [Nematocida minor]|uniref:uncharacterized protein n=1 Tax=Nematocida minor TaxID=1912983 RepID=UPI00221F9355|nr:uncharacterized protein NEMIN01_1157 [Nematocida minor]KAI5190692.1 hypothetical protein NEMIN01_1157 [Nematocida minor]